ncbi:DIS3-like exonuclease 2 [Cichlidogyrus casuarinus]|uniref:DIS3-like exonuclease 2 n=1 Tax=Cichlidogyrus casuarinus TaxID=1844966 RepID=A0ABD2Q3T7_9PLAT
MVAKQSFSAAAKGPGRLSAERVCLKAPPATLLEGQLFVLDHYTAYIIHPVDGSRVFINGPKHRGRAVSNDYVSVQLLPVSKWQCQLLVEPAPQQEPVMTLPEHYVENQSLEKITNHDLDPIVNPKYSSQLVSSRNFSSMSKVGELIGLRPDVIPILFPKMDPKDITELLASTPNPFVPMPSPLLYRTGTVRSILWSELSRRKIYGTVHKTNDIVHFKPTTKFPRIQAINQVDDCDPDKLYYVEGFHYSNQFRRYFGVVKPASELSELQRACQIVLSEHGVAHSTNFDEQCYENLPQSEQDFVIPEKEFLTRRDYRNRCVFTLDPSTAKDIDDAIHITQIKDDLYEVGVHIADVSYFVKSGSALDNEASDRCTSIYYADKVIPMLPPILSEQLCSLNPGVERLAFSVVFTIKSSGQLVDQWIGRSIIRSCSKLSYETAQQIIDSREKKLPAPENVTVHEPYTVEQVSRSLQQLIKITRNLRETRIENGALTMSKVEIKFEIPTNEDSDVPSSYYPKQILETNNLVEELMLLTNQTIAKCLYNAISLRGKPSRFFESSQKPTWQGAFLRRHPPPSTQNVSKIIANFASMGFKVVTTSSATLRASLEEAFKQLNNDQGLTAENRRNKQLALSFMTLVLLSLAQYFSVDDFLGKRLMQKHYENQSEDLNPFDSKERVSMADFSSAIPGFEDLNSLLEYAKHFGLATGLYTHFTSPIRRYADLIVHRQVASVLGITSHLLDKDLSTAQSLYSKLTTSVKDSVHSVDLMMQAFKCNVKRNQSRKAQEIIKNLYYVAHVKKYGPLKEKVVLVSAGSREMQVLIKSTGTVLRIPPDQVSFPSVCFNFLAKLFAKGTYEFPPIDKKKSKNKLLNNTILVAWENGMREELQLLDVVDALVYVNDDRKWRLSLHIIPPSKSP